MQSAVSRLPSIESQGVSAAGQEPGVTSCHYQDAGSEVQGDHVLSSHIFSSLARARARTHTHTFPLDEKQRSRLSSSRGKLTLSLKQGYYQ